MSDALTHLQAIIEQDNAALDAQIERADRSAEDDAAIKRLAALPAVEYDRVRTAEAKRLGIRAGTLDEMVKRERPAADGKDLQGHELVLDDPEPWPEPVDGAALLDDLVAAARQYLVLPDGGAEMMALWAIVTHTFSSFYFAPRINFTAPTKGCGKSVALDWLGSVTPRSVRTESVTTAVLFRLTDAHQPILLIDEADRYLRDDQELIAAINAGHRRGGHHLRCEGDGNTVRAFKTFAPVALAGIGKLPATIADRSIPITMRRATKEESASLRQFRADRIDREEVLRRKAARWAADHAMRLAGHDPDIPDGIFNRAADNWRPLLAVADLAGGHWPDTARQAARKLASVETSDDEAGVMLLADLRDLFSQRGVDRLASADIAEALARLEDRPWPEWRSGKPVTPRQIARLLDPFNVTPATIRTATGTPKGYRLDQFDEAFRSYLVDRSATPPQPLETGHFGGFQSATRMDDVADRNDEKPRQTAACGGVADENPSEWGGDV